MSRTNRAWFPKWFAGHRPARPRSTRLRLENMEHRITPTTYYVTPPMFFTDATSLRNAVNSATDGDVIALEGGYYPLTSNQLNITHNLTFIRDTVVNPNSTPIEIQDDSSGTPGILALSSGKTLTVSDDMQLDGGITGSGALDWHGSGTLTLTMSTGGASTYSGGTTYDNGGNIDIGSGASFGTGTVTGSGFAALTTVTWTADNTVTNIFSLDGSSLAVSTGATLTVDGAQISGGYLESGSGIDGTFSTDATAGRSFYSITSYANVVSNSPADVFHTFTNDVGATVTVSAGVNTGGTSTTINFDNFTNDSGGTLEIGATSIVNAQNLTNDQSGSITMDDRSVMNAYYLYSQGTLTLMPSLVSGYHTLLNNLGGMGFGQYSQTTIGTAATASAYPAGIDLQGHDVTVSAFRVYDYTLMAYVPGAVLNNNGFVVDTSSGGTATLIVDGNGTNHGAEVKGAGYFQNAVTTQNDGYFLAGDCPGMATFDNFVMGPFGVSTYQFQIDDPTGTAGPSPDAQGHVNGWSSVRTGNFSFAADSDDKLTVDLQTLATSTTEGNDVAGTMANFDPTKSYSWAAVTWTGTYSGPTDDASLNAATTFDTSGFSNIYNGTFAWHLDTTAKTLYLTYTPE